jgi:hypothetical protein
MSVRRLQNALELALMHGKRCISFVLDKPETFFFWRLRSFVGLVSPLGLVDYAAKQLCAAVRRSGAEPSVKRL